MQRRQLVGWVFMILVNLIWAVGYPVTQIALQVVTPETLTVIRLATGAAVLMPFLFKGTKWTRSTILWSIILGIVGFTLPFVLSMTGLQKSDSAMAAISISLEPLSTIIFGALYTRTRLSLQTYVALAIAIVGGWVVAGCPRPGFAGYVVGDILLILGVLCYGFYNVMSPQLSKRAGSVSAAALTLLFGAISSLPMLAIPHAHHSVHLSPSGTVLSWLAVLFVSVIGTAAAYVIWLFVLERIDISSAALSLYLQPVFGVVFSILILGQHPSWLFYAGSIMILAAIAIGTRVTPAPEAPNGFETV